MNIAGVPVTVREMSYQRYLRPRTRYWQRRWNSMPKKARERLLNGTMIEYSVDVEELCAAIGNGARVSVPPVPFDELLAQVQREIASR